MPLPWEYAQWWLSTREWKDTTMGEALEQRAVVILHLGAPYDNETDGINSTKCQFEVIYNLAEMHQFLVRDYYQHISTSIPRVWLEDMEFNLYEWYAQHLHRLDQDQQMDVATNPRCWLALKFIVDGLLAASDVESDMSTVPDDLLDVNGIQVDQHKYPALQRNAA